MNKFVKILVQLVNNYCCILFYKKLFPSASATLNFETVKCKCDNNLFLMQYNIGNFICKCFDFAR